MEVQAKASGGRGGIWRSRADAARSAQPVRTQKDAWLLDTVLSRCVVDDDSGCWRWTGCIHARSGRAQMRRHGQSVFVDTEAWRAVHGAIRRGLILVRTGNCDHADCCNPAHRRSMTRRAHGRLLVRTGRASSGAGHRLATGLGKPRRKRYKLSLRLARWMRQLAANGSPRRDLARQFGVDISMVGRVLRYDAWTEASPWDLVTALPRANARSRQQRRTVGNEARYRIAA